MSAIAIAIAPGLMLSIVPHAATGNVSCARNMFLEVEWRNIWQPTRLGLLNCYGNMTSPNDLARGMKEVRQQRIAELRLTHIISAV